MFDSDAFEIFWYATFFFPFVLSDNMPSVRWREAEGIGIAILTTFTNSPHK